MYVYIYIYIYIYIYMYVDSSLLGNFVLGNYLPRRRRPRTGDITTPPSVCPSVRHV